MIAVEHDLGQDLIKTAAPHCALDHPSMAERAPSNATPAESVTNLTRSKRKSLKNTPVSLQIRDFAHLASVNLSFGDLTVVVGPQGAGKSLALQWLKIALDGRQVVEALRAAGHQAERSVTLIDLIFGTGTATGWHLDSTTIKFGSVPITLNSIARRGTGKEELFFVPAHRSMLISDGWAAPFQKLNSDTPVVARLFSQNLFDRFSGKDAGTLFPVEKRLKKVIREKIDDAVFHGGKAGIEEDQQHALRLSGYVART